MLLNQTKTIVFSEEKKSLVVNMQHHKNKMTSNRLEQVEQDIK
jgi:hypothetical protein